MGNMHVTLFIVFLLTQMHDFSENLQVFLGVYGFRAYGLLDKTCFKQRSDVTICLERTCVRQAWRTASFPSMFVF